MMGKFILKHILEPLSGRWLSGVLLMLLWTIAFIALPAISGWFLAACSLAFITANALFAYLIPSSVIRLLALIRTATRYFERFNNHQTTLEAQRNLQLEIFRSVARFPYFNKQVNNNTSILENSTYGIDLILNHVLLWLLPFSALIISLLIYFLFLFFFAQAIAIEFLVSSAFLLFILPQYIFLKNRKLYSQLKAKREENNQALIQSFRGRIEISKYNLEGKAFQQFEQNLVLVDGLERKLQTNSFSLQHLAGFCFSATALLILWGTSHSGISAPMAIGIFFGIMAQAELAEMLFSGKSEKSSVANQMSDLDSIIKQGNRPVEPVQDLPVLQHIMLQNFRAKIPETQVVTNEISIEIRKGEWIALYGETGKGKTTLLNSLFYPEYRYSGILVWNECADLGKLPIPACIYVTQKAYLLTGSLRENFEGIPDKDIEQVLKTVDLSDWYLNLPKGLDSWLGENGETLSGGQRKKLLLAQALLKNPQLLVVDEPTAGIGAENARAIFREIRKHFPDITILMATHLKDFEAEVDKIIRI
jgi:ATP-binding cassette, subfamily C, bacterial CydC